MFSKKNLHPLKTIGDKWVCYQCLAIFKNEINDVMHVHGIRCSGKKKCNLQNCYVLETIGEEWVCCHCLTIQNRDAQLLTKCGAHIKSKSVTPAEGVNKCCRVRNLLRCGWMSLLCSKLQKRNDDMRNRYSKRRKPVCADYPRWQAPFSMRLICSAVVTGSAIIHSLSLSSLF